MEKAIFHIFLNSPVGRENLLQSAYLAQVLKPRMLSVFIPTHDQCVLYCDATALTLDLDDSYIRYPETARSRVQSVLADFDIYYDFYTPPDFTAGVLPDIPNDFAILACPRAISKHSGRIGLGHFGTKVRRILVHVPFPLFIPAGAFKPWSRVVALFSGSNQDRTTVRIADSIASRAKVPLEIYTQLGDTTREQCEDALAETTIKGRIDHKRVAWRIFDSGTLEQNLFEVPHDSLVVVGTGEHSLVEEVLFGTTLETLQALLPNPLVVCGPKCRPEIELD